MFQALAELLGSRATLASQASAATLEFLASAERLDILEFLASVELPALAATPA